MAQIYYIIFSSVQKTERKKLSTQLVDFAQVYYIGSVYIKNNNTSLKLVSVNQDLHDKNGCS